MTFALGHLVGAWLLGKTYEKVNSKNISHDAWFFLLFGGILPDADFLVDWILGLETHRTVTHSVLFLIIAPLFLYVVLRLLHSQNVKQYSLALCVGIGSHLLLDMATSSHGVPLFWPSLWYISFYRVGYFDPNMPSFLHRSASELRYFLKLTIVDMAIGTAWIFYLWMKKKIEF